MILCFNRDSSELVTSSACQNIIDTDLWNKNQIPKELGLANIRITQKASWISIRKVILSNQWELGH